VTPRSLVRDLPHLVRRFLGHLRSSPLAPAEQDWVNGWLRPPERALFWTMATADQRHAVDTAREVARRMPADRTAVRAGLLHDVGKRHSRAGVIGRSLATVCEALRIPMPADWRRYRDHGALGASDLAAAGSEPLVVEFARLHPAGPPDGLSADVWNRVLAADRR
jgi:hypothetical protein